MLRLAETREAAAALWIGRLRGFSSKLQKERYEQRTDSKVRKFDLEAARSVVPKDLPTWRFSLERR